ncbi:DUF86 domain-containing protein [Candidatus Woesearchaeota archaeon]|nr:DUF86 domain-containing protein [Candidatus Woesearchaeota archaeon]
MKRIKDKIDEINRFLDELKEIFPENYEMYDSDLKTKAACERYFEKIIESAVDLAFIFIKIKKLPVPQDDADSFKILEKNKIIDKELSENLIKAKGMRNIIIHQYGKIDDELVFDAIENKLEKDISEFVKKIENDK